MSWFRKDKPKKRRKRAPRKGPGTLSVVIAGGRLLLNLRVLRYAWLVAFAIGAAWGIDRLESRVLARPEFHMSPNIYFTDAPEGIEQRVAEQLKPFADMAWITSDLCARIGDELETSAWVQKLNEVRRYADGTVAISCDYRQPAALVQIGAEYFLIAPDGVRLPGQYGYHPSLVVIQGVSTLAPVAGLRWPGNDVEAALEIVRLMRDKPFYDQITGVQVHNYAGRVNRREPHIILATAPSGSRIVWGSAPGEEIEENSIDEKMQLLWENFRRWGRIDAGRDYIDISTFPDRFTTRGGG